MKFTKIIFVSALLLSLSAYANSAKQRPVIWNTQQLNNVKAKVKEKNPVYYEAYQSLIRNAREELTKPNLTVMSKKKAPLSGDKHDYASLSRYYWPNPNTKDGLPYLSRDGESNPELNEYDRNRLGDMCNSVCNLSLAYYFTHDKAYSEKAVSILRTWFLDPATKVNPNLQYSQFAPGINGGYGRPSGMIDAYSYIGLIDAVLLLDSQKAIPAKELQQLRSWFGELSQWMLTAENGIMECNATNNHSIAYDVQVATFSYFAGKDSITKRIIREFPQRRLAAQVQPDGSQPRELTRTIAFHYSNYNLVHMIDMCDLASKMGVNLYPSSNNAIDRAIGWLIPFLGKPESFPYKQINDWKTVEVSFAQQLYRASAYSKDPRYVKLYNQYKAQPEDYMFTLLFIQ